MEFELSVLRKVIKEMNCGTKYVLTDPTDINIIHAFIRVNVHLIGTSLQNLTQQLLCKIT